MSQKETRKAEVKATGKKIEVYKFTTGHPTADHIWNVYLGEGINVAKVSANEHLQTFKESELKFIQSPNHNAKQQ